MGRKPGGCLISCRPASTPQPAHCASGEETAAAPWRHGPSLRAWNFIVATEETLIMDSHKLGTPPAREDACPESCGHFRIGLPILPVRYAVLGDGLEAARAGCRFRGSGLAGLGVQGARYGLRLLRRGYVYRSTTRTIASWTATWLPAKDLVEIAAGRARAAGSRSPPSTVNGKSTGGRRPA